MNCYSSIIASLHRLSRQSGRRDGAHRTGPDLLLAALLIASMAHRISPWLRKVGRRFNQACGGVFVAIGVALPLRA